MLETTVTSADGPASANRRDGTGRRGKSSVMNTMAARGKFNWDHYNPSNQDWSVLAGSNAGNSWAAELDFGNQRYRVWSGGDCGL